MKLKKIVKLVVLFSMMNLIGSVVWAGPTTGEKAESECKAPTGVVVKDLTTDALTEDGKPAKKADEAGK